MTFGCNDEGALGRVTSEEGSETKPGKLPLCEEIVQLSAGDSHTAALTMNGRVFLTGTFRVSSLHSYLGLHFVSFKILAR